MVVQPVSSCYIPSVARLFPKWLASPSRKDFTLVSTNSRQISRLRWRPIQVITFWSMPTTIDAACHRPRRRIICANRALRNSFTVGAICWVVSADRALRLKMLPNRIMYRRIRFQAVFGHRCYFVRLMCASKRGDLVKQEPRA